MRLLVIEDEPDLLSGIAGALRAQGYAVDTAGDGLDGLYKAEATDYDAIVLDIMLPRLDGWTVLARLRRKKSTPVLMLTARDLTADRVRGLDAGADDYLVKPFDVPELLARIRVLLRRKAGQSSSVITIDDVKIDTVAHTVTKAGEPVPLTGREYTMLEHFALHRGAIITRTTLYEHLFDENDSTLSNLIDVHISNLRKKLGHDVILTHRGHGYQMP